MEEGEGGTNTLYAVCLDPATTPTSKISYGVEGADSFATSVTHHQPTSKNILELSVSVFQATMMLLDLSHFQLFTLTCANVQIVLTQKP